jgi:hypothetical protein
LNYLFCPFNNMAICHLYGCLWPPVNLWLFSNSVNIHRLEMKEKLGLSFITRPINNNNPFLYNFIWFRKQEIYVIKKKKNSYYC